MKTDLDRIRVFLNQAITDAIEFHREKKCAVVTFIGRGTIKSVFYSWRDVRSILEDIEDYSAEYSFLCDDDLIDLVRSDLPVIFGDDWEDYQNHDFISFTRTDLQDCLYEIVTVWQL